MVQVISITLQLNKIDFNRRAPPTLLWKSVEKSFSHEIRDWRVDMVYKKIKGSSTAKKREKNFLWSYPLIFFVIRFCFAKRETTKSIENQRKSESFIQNLDIVDYTVHNIYNLAIKPANVIIYIVLGLM